MSGPTVLFRTFSQNTSKPSLGIFREVLKNGVDINYSILNSSTLLIDTYFFYIFYNYI